MTGTGTAMAKKRGGSTGGLQERGLSPVRRLVLGAIPLIVLLLAWQHASSTGLLDSRVFPVPYDLLVKAVELTRSGELLDHTLVSMGRVLSGLGLSILIALPLGFLMGGMFKTVETAINPLVLMFSQVNPFVLWPVFLLLLGFDEQSKVAMVMWVAIWPIMFGTAAGIRSADPALVKMARSLGLNKAQLFEKVLLPGAVPSVIAGIRFAALLSFFVLIGAEMLGATSGLGWLIMNSCPYHTFPVRLEKMWIGIAMVALLGALMDRSLLRLERRLSGWKEEVEV